MAMTIPKTNIPAQAEDIRRLVFTFSVVSGSIIGFLPF
jgi:hypothetical protein